MGATLQLRGHIASPRTGILNHGQRQLEQGAEIVRRSEIEKRSYRDECTRTEA